MTDNRPVHTLSYGTIRVSIWCNPAPFGDFYNVIPSRSYKKDDAWRDSNSFGEFDLPLLGKAILDAHSWIQTHKGICPSDLALPCPNGQTDDDSGGDD